MISPADQDRIMAQLETIAQELALIGARMKVISADLSRLREKLL